MSSGQTNLAPMTIDLGWTSVYSVVFAFRDAHTFHVPFLWPGLGGRLGCRLRHNASRHTFLRLLKAFSDFKIAKRDRYARRFLEKEKKRFHPLTSYREYIEIEIEFIQFHAFSSKIIESIKWIWYLRSREKYKVEEPIESILHSRFGKCRIWE